MPGDPVSRVALAAVRVYCLPHAGGAADSFLPWARSTGRSALRFIPVELPGHGTRRGEPLLTSMHKVTDGLLAMLAGRPRGEPFVLFGHSMGAQIAYETARRLSAHARPMPLALVVSGSRPAGLRDPRRLHTLSDEALLERVGRMGGTPDAVLRQKGVARMVLPALRADLALLADYTARLRPVRLPCPIMALGGAADELAGPESIAAWGSLTSARFRFRILPGGHFFLHAQRSAVAAEIGASLAAA